mmetsp:Transcript_7816/g.25883  ORF Transcript_7816/g.25883 Transcript_7816/m.25883 type:complete len:774 (+) Transcript_7816:77-2398(+)
MTHTDALLRVRRRVGVLVAVFVAYACLFAAVARADDAAVRWQLTTLRSVTTSATTDGGYAREVSFTITALDLTYDVRASINEGLVGVNFSAKRQLSPERRRRLLSASSDVEVTEIANDAFEVVHENAPRSLTRCQYSGVVENVAATTSVAVALCDNFIKGQIIVPNASLAFAQVSEADAGAYLASATLPAGLDPLEYVVLNVTTFEAHRDGAIDTPRVVGADALKFKDLDGNVVDASRVKRSSPPATPVSGRKLLVSSAPRYLEVIAVNDKARCDQFYGDVNALEADTLFAINVANSLYSSAFSPTISIILRDIISFTSRDPYSASTASSTILDNINEWRAANYDSLTAHDIVHLLSGLDFDGSTIGLASQYTSTLDSSVCDQGQYCSSVGVDYCAVDGSNTQLGCCLQTASISQVWAASSQKDAITIAHEIGHQLGFSHDYDDSDGCAESGDIMAATSSYEVEVDWSSCTNAEYLAKIDSAYHTCLLAADTTATSVCGNGIVEAGEECDCPDNDCTCYDNCCDGATCRLVSGAACSAVDGCCDETTCTIKAANTVCRAAESVCDTQEVCDGTSKSCPADLYLAYGTACTDANGDRGSCWNNECRNRDFQCQRVSEGTLFGGARASTTCSSPSPYVIETATSCSSNYQAWYCFANNYSCTASGVYYPTLNAPQGFPCTTASSGAYSSVCDGLGSCVTLSSIMPTHVAPLAESTTQRTRSCQVSATSPSYSNLDTFPPPPPPGNSTEAVALGSGAASLSSFIPASIALMLALLC